MTTENTAPTKSAGPRSGWDRNDHLRGVHETWDLLATTAWLSEIAVANCPKEQAQKTSQEIALCDALAEGCGFRGRNFARSSSCNAAATEES